MSSATLDRGAPGAHPPAEAPAAPDPLRGTPPRRVDVLVASVLAVVVVAIAWVWRSPIVPTDPWHYVHRALTFPDSVWIPLGYTRYGIIVPNILPARLFGNAEASYYFWPMLSIAALAALIYLVARRWWGPAAGIVAVVVLFTNSIVFYNMTRLYPDVMAVALIQCALFTALMARDRDFRGRAGVAWILATGFFLGWSFEVRETALFAWPLIIAVLWRRGSVLRVLGWTALPALGWAALDVFVSAVAYGDPLLKVRTLLGFGGPATDPADVAVAQARTRLDVLLAIPERALASRPDGLWLVAIAVVAILTAVLAVRNRPLRLVAIGFTYLYAVNLLAGGLILPSRPFGDLLNVRYWIQYVPWLALVVGGLVGCAAPALARRVGARSRTAQAVVAGALAVAACIIPVTSAVRTIPTIAPYALNGGDALEELRTHLADADYPDATVWTDSRTRRLLPIFQRGFFGGDKLWDGPVRTLGDPERLQPGDLVVLYSATDDTCYHCWLQINPWLKENPGARASWERLFRTESGNLELYRVR